MNIKSKNTKKIRLVRKKNIRKSKRKIEKTKDNKNNIKKEEIDKIFNDFRSKLSALKQKQGLVISKFLDDLRERQIKNIKNSINF